MFVPRVPEGIARAAPYERRTVHGDVRRRLRQHDRPRFPCRREYLEMSILSLSRYKEKVKQNASNL